VGTNACVKDKQEEIFVIPKSNAVEDPVAMMVHLQNALLAHPAVMASIRFEFCTPLATAPTIVPLSL
jgi:hypothetical protein